MKRRREGGIPSMPRDIAFCEAWLEHFELRKAWQVAGYSLKNKGWACRAQLKLKRFSEYLRPLQAAKAQQVGAQLAVTQGDVLETMRQVAFANPQDYYVVSDEPIMREEKDAEGNVVHVPVTVNGSPVYDLVQKRLENLTREQAMAVVPMMSASGSYAGYRLPSVKERHAYLTSLGQNLGLFLPEIAKEAHAHLHRHSHLHLDDVPTAVLDDLQHRLIAVVGPDQARNLGISQQEIDEALMAYGGQEGLTRGAP